MSEQVAENPPEQAPEKTEEQLLQEQKIKEEEEKAKEEERKRIEEEAKIKKEQDMKKLQEALKDSLSLLTKTPDNKTLAYARLILAEKQLQRVFPTILKFKYIQHLDINTNALVDVSILTEFPYLLTLNVSKNQIQDLDAFTNEQKLTKLQFLNISGNKLKKLTQVALPSLKKLTLIENQISQVCEWKGHATIEILELRKNKLRKLKGLINMKSLKQLYVGQNQLTDIRGLQNLPHLTKLSVRANKLTKIMNPFPYLPSLRYLNLRENQISKIEELKKIDIHVNDLNLLANPLTDQLGEDAKKKIIEELPHFIRLNKSLVSEEDRITFEKQRQQRLVQQEKQRKQKEQEEKAKLAEGGAQGDA